MSALRCSFCNRTVGEVEKIIGGPNPARPVHICNECVEVCVGILRDGAGQDIARKRFNLRLNFWEPPNPGFTIAALILAGVLFSVAGYFIGGVPKSKELAVVWLVGSIFGVLFVRLLRLGHVNK